MRYITAASFLMVLFLHTSVSMAFAANDWEVFSIASGTHDQDAPDIDGNIVVWHDNSSGEHDIYGHNLATGATFPVSLYDGAQVRPSVSSNVVVWEDHRGTDSGTGGNVFGYNLSTNQEFAIYQKPGLNLSAVRPEISGDWVVWGEYRAEANGYGVYAKNLLTMQEKNLHLGGSQPAIGLHFENGLAVWQEYAGANQKNDIFGYDFTNNTPLTISSNPEYQFDPSTDGKTVVWQDRRKGTPSDMDIYGWDLATGNEFAIETTSKDTRNPAVDDDLVIWTADADIYGYHLSTGMEFLIAEDVSPQGLKISDNHIVWTSYNFSTNDFDIYGARHLPEPTTFAMLLLGAHLGIGRRLRS